MNLDERMKFYEQAEAGRRCMPCVPIMARIDGRAFHGWALNLARPFDADFRALMTATASALVEASHARLGYTQSDEITLLFHSEAIESQVFFDGKIHKMVSVLASLATAHFNALVPTYLPARVGTLAVFDCRVWQVPTRDEAVNAFIWREMDATRNSVEMAARAKFSHRELHQKNTKEMQEMLWSKHGINWSDYPAAFKRGTYVQRRTRLRLLTDEERERIPPQHRPPAAKLVERGEVVALDLPPILSVANRAAVFFDGADPVMNAPAPEAVSADAIQNDEGTAPGVSRGGR